VLEPPGDLGFEQEPGAAGGVGGALGAVLSGVRVGGNAVQRGVEHGIGQLLQLVAAGAEPVGGHQALLRIASISRQGLVDQLLQQIVLRQGQGPLLDQVSAQRF